MGKLNLKSFSLSSLEVCPPWKVDTFQDENVLANAYDVINTFNLHAGNSSLILFHINLEKLIYQAYTCEFFLLPLFLLLL